jgi:hypothetical protein
MENKRIQTRAPTVPHDPFTLLNPDTAYVKFLIWGPAGSGKTVWGLSADKPAYISLESGADRYAQLGVSTFSPKNLAELGQTLRFLKHADYSYQTIVLDSVSVAWSMFMEEYCPEGVKPDWVAIKLKWKRFLRTLLGLRKDVILIGRAKESRAEGSSWYIKTGDLILDSEISTAFEFDFVGFSFSYTDQHSETSEIDYKIRLDKVRDLTGKVKTGMVLTNSTFKQFKSRLTGLTKPKLQDQPHQNRLSSTTQPHPNQTQQRFGTEPNQYVS